MLLAVYVDYSSLFRTVQFKDKVIKNANRKPYTIYRMIPLSMTFSDLWPDFKVTTFFDIEYLRNDTRKSHSYYKTQYEVICAVSNGDLEWHLTQISRSQYYWRRIFQKRCVLGTKFLKNTNMKPYTIYRMIPLSMTLSDLYPISRSRHFSTLNISETTRDRAIVTVERL